MTYRENIRAILECHFAGFKEEIIESACNSILEQEPKTGHWITIDDCEKFIAKCSECGQIEDSRMIGKYAYCMQCGAKMVDPQERSKKE